MAGEYERWEGPNLFGKPGFIGNKNDKMVEKPGHPGYGTRRGIIRVNIEVVIHKLRVRKMAWRVARGEKNSKISFDRCYDVRGYAGKKPVGSGKRGMKRAIIGPDHGRGPRRDGRKIIKNDMTCQGRKKSNMGNSQKRNDS